MGMYCYVEGVQTKFYGLLADAVVQCVIDGFHDFNGVELNDDMLVCGGSVTLTAGEVRTVVWEMRNQLLEGPGKYNQWNLSTLGNSAPLNNLQDVHQFAADVKTFSALTTWLVHSWEEELTWA